MSTALVSAFYDVDDVLYQNRINSNMTRSSVMHMEPRKITGMTNLLSQNRHQIPQQSQHQSLSQNSQFRSRTGSISSTSSVQSDNSGYSFSNSSSASMGSPSSTSSVISSLSGSMPPSPVDYGKQLDRSVSEPSDSSRNREISKQDMVNKANQNNINSSRYKTELCRPFEENGYCKYGEKCQFAHGAQELRSLSRHPKYKTELCRTYHTIGFCPYGPRCHFIHNDEERRLAQQQHQQSALQSLKRQEQIQRGSTQQQQTSPSPSHSNPHFSAGQPSQVIVPRQHHLQQQHASLQQHHLRPRSLNFNLLQVQRDSLGSTADSPPSSITDSPTMSPTFFGEEIVMGSAFSPIPASAPAGLQQSSAFPFQDLGVMPAAAAPSTSNGAHQQVVSAQQQPTPPSMMSPLNVQTDQMVTLAAQLHALTVDNHRNNNMNTNDALLRESLDFPGVYAPPSPPESLASSSSSSNDSISGICGSPLEVSRSLRLPIFSKLSCSDESD